LNPEVIRRILPYLFLLYGLYSVVSLQRDFQHTTRLMVYLFLLVPVFLFLSFIYRWYEQDRVPLRMQRYHTYFHWVSRSMIQTLTQYILMFCLPFFSVSERWIYFGFTLILLATTLWDPWWSKLLHSWLYRRLLQLWSLLCATSFLFPFLWPDKLEWYYGALVVAGMFSVLPSQKQKSHLYATSALLGFLLLVSVILPLSWRFPILSVWLQSPRFETDTHIKDETHLVFGKEVQLAKVQKLLAEGHHICCHAPIVAPGSIREKVQQEWTLNGQLLERPLLKTTIAGNPFQRAFRSYYCKQNFTLMQGNDLLRCRLYLHGDIYLGEVALDIKP
jgi:hypothetical protein